MEKNDGRAEARAGERWIDSCLPGSSDLQDFAGPGGLANGSIERLARQVGRSLRRFRRERARLRRLGRGPLESWLRRRVKVEGAEALVESCREGRPVLVVLPFTRSALAALMFLALRLGRSLVVPRYPILEAVVSPWVDGAAAGLVNDPGVPGITIIPPSVKQGLGILGSRAALLVTFPDLWHGGWPAAKASFLGRPIRASVYEGLLRARVPALGIFPMTGAGDGGAVDHLLRVGPEMSREEPADDDLRTVVATGAHLVLLIEETARRRPQDLLSWRSLHGCLATSQLARLRIEAGMIRSCLALLEVQDPATSSRAAHVRSLAEAAARALREAMAGDASAVEAFRERARAWDRPRRARTA